LTIIIIPPWFRNEHPFVPGGKVKGLYVAEEGGGEGREKGKEKKKEKRGKKKKNKNDINI
jgi:hypothetical protein